MWPRRKTQSIPKPTTETHGSATLARLKAMKAANGHEPEDDLEARVDKLERTVHTLSDLESRRHRLHEAPGA